MTIDIEYPFTGRWIARNSPANRVPSHGTELFGSAYSIDFVPVDADGRTARFTARSLLRPEPPEAFPGFGRPLTSPVDGTVIAAYDGDRDHPAYRGLLSLGYALSQRRRLAAGWPGLAGNHVLIAVRGAYLALCHLRRGSVEVRAGERVRVGERVGRCGNSGNSTEPHLHLQAIDRADPVRARPVPIALRGGLPRNGEIIDVDAREPRRG